MMLNSKQFFKECNKISTHTHTHTHTHLYICVYNINREYTLNFVINKI